MFHLTRPSLRKRDPFFDFDNEVGRFLNNWDPIETQLSIPKCDVRELEHSFSLSFDIPGVKKEDLSLEVKDNVLTVTGERRSEKTDSDKFLRQEVKYGKFSRSFSLPEGANEEAIEANFENGVLTVHLPKTEKKKAKKISIL